MLGMIPYLCGCVYSLYYRKNNYRFTRFTMASDPFKARVSKPHPKKPLLLSQAKLNQLISDSQLIESEKSAEERRIEERRKRLEATKALTKKVVRRKEPGSELRKQQYAQDLKNAHLELEREERIEARRNYVLDLAYKRLFEETDRVKHFKTAKNLATMLKQRDEQVEAKSNMKDLYSKYEKEFVIGMLKDVEAYREEEEKKVEKAKKDKVVNATNWGKQRDEVEKKKKVSEWEHLRDGYLVREAAEKYFEEVTKKELKLKKKIRDYKEDLDKQKDEKETLMETHAKLDEADEKRAQIFNEAKRDMQKKHKEIKDELEKKKQLKRECVSKNLVDESGAIKAKEEEIRRKAVLQSEAKVKDECAVKQVKQEEALKAIQEFYEKEMAKKFQRQLEERREGFQDRRKILEKVEKLQQAEDIKLQSKRNLEKEAQHLQLHQIEKKQMDRAMERQEDIKDYIKHMRSLDEEEEIFQKYAQMEIAECESRGIDTRAMKAAARPGIECGRGPLYEYRGNIRPKYYSAAVHGDELNHIKRELKRPNTKSRLGFKLH